MGKVNNLINKTIQNMPRNLSKNEQIRYIYIQIGRKVKKDVIFFYGNDTQKEKIYNKETSIKEKNSYSVICKSIADIYVEAFKRIGIESETLKRNNDSDNKIAHIDITVKGENDKLYHLNPMFDLFKIQMGCRTKRFANKTQKYPDLSFSYMTGEEIKQIDNKIGYTWNGMYTDEVFETLKNEVHNRRLLKEHIKENIPEISSRQLNMRFICQYKLEFILNYLKEFTTSFERIYRSKKLF